MSLLEQSPIPSLKERLAGIREKIRSAAQKSGRAESEISLVAVTKTVPVERISEAISLGVRDIAESKVQEALSKFPLLVDARPSEGLRRHFVGHLQSNKARKAVELFDVIQSVDRPSIGQALDRIAVEFGKNIECLVEVNMGSVPNRSGIPEGEAKSLISSFQAFSRLRLKGLMTIAPLGLTANETRSFFRQFSGFFSSVLKFFSEPAVLSMGMSDDFEVAVEEGSTMVRIGRALFGPRPLAVGQR